jgi:CRISPR-associated endoribonuclease Cas6
MQLTVFFNAPSTLAVPVHYGTLLQGLIYRQMQNPALRHYLHEHGFLLEKRRFKLFTFSRLMGKTSRFDRFNGSIVFTPPLRLVICSPIPFILQELGSGFLRQGHVLLGDARLEVKEVAAASPRVSSSSIRVRMLSPVVMYSTAKPESGRSYTYYYSPFEPRFAELIGANLAKKYLLIYGHRAEQDSFNIRPAEVGEKDFKITRYKETTIKGWLGEYYLSGDPELLQVALDAGLGARNSQGYGCCVLVG